MITLKTAKTLIKSKGLNDNTEVTRHKGKYHLLHICRNGVPVPLIISTDLAEVLVYIDHLNQA